MDLINSAPTSEVEATIVDEVEAAETESFTDVAVAIDEAAYLCGWHDAVRAVVGAMRNAGSSESDEYFDGWMDAIERRPIDATRLVTSRSDYARGHAEGTRQYELAHRGGYDAE
jgi:hypothetical protein